MRALCWEMVVEAKLADCPASRNRRGRQRVRRPRRRTRSNFVFALPRSLLSRPLLAVSVLIVSPYGGRPSHPERLRSDYSDRQRLARKRRSSSAARRRRTPAITVKRRIVLPPKVMIFPVDPAGLLSCMRYRRTIPGGSLSTARHSPICRIKPLNPEWGRHPVLVGAQPETI